jgi:hypothetical protein
MQDIIIASPVMTCTFLSRRKMGLEGVQLLLHLHLPLDQATLQAMFRGMLLLSDLVIFHCRRRWVP